VRTPQSGIFALGTASHARDALTRYTRPLTGAYYFVPSTESLRTIVEP
jgi:deferrochelatase/peroxidase EfeB